MKRIMFLSIFVELLMIVIFLGFIVLYGFLIRQYDDYFIAIIIIFMILTSGLFYANDVLQRHLSDQAIGKRILLKEAKIQSPYPRSFPISEIKRKAFHQVYMFEGFAIPVEFVEKVEGRHAFTYPILNQPLTDGTFYEVLEHYRYHYFLVRDLHHKQYIIHRKQIDN